MSNKTILSDLVCGMSVDSDDISADYQGDHYAFCSEQCRERFQANPQLYIGTKNNRPDPDNRDSCEYQTIKLAEALPVDVVDSLRKDIREMMGIRYIEFYENEIEIAYDPFQVTELQIATTLTRCGEMMGEEWAAILDPALRPVATETTESYRNRNQRFS